MFPVCQVSCCVHVVCFTLTHLHFLFHLVLTFFVLFQALISSLCMISTCVYSSRTPPRIGFTCVPLPSWLNMNHFSLCLVSDVFDCLSHLYFVVSCHFSELFSFFGGHYFCFSKFKLSFKFEDKTLSCLPSKMAPGQWKESTVTQS